VHFGSPELLRSFMDSVEQLQVFQAQTKNVRMLDQASRQINRTINHALRKNDNMSCQVHTKVLALIFCAWIEANFSKVIHTPYGFTPEEIDQIKRTHQRLGLGPGWKKCIELGLRRISNPQKSNYIPNIRLKLFSIVDDYVVSSSQIRNKIAHGQWHVALNRDNDAVNNELTQELNNLDTVIISIWFQVHQHLSNIVEALIESPNRAFQRDYWQEIAKLEAFLDETHGWSISEKLTRLQKKPIKH
jgi:hypothetical protein